MIRRVLCIFFGVLAPAFALAQAYPAKPVRVIIPFPPGQGTDVIGRIVVQRLADTLGQTFPVDNRPGAGGIIGMETGARATPDGYTLLVTASGTLAINPSLYKKLSYDPVKDYAPIALLAKITFVMVSHPSLPAGSIKQLIALAKARPGEINFGSSGAGTGVHLAMELFKSQAGVNIVHVPYRGSAPALTDLIGGQIMLLFDAVASSSPHIRSGALRALAVSTAKRSAALPDVPSMSEAGVTGYEAVGWAGMLAPAGTPSEIVMRLNERVVRILGEPDVRERATRLGMELAPNSPREFGEFIQSEMVKWARAVKLAGIRPE